MWLSLCTNHIFLFLTEILANKKKQYSDLARQINTTKVDIDKSRTKLEELKEEREANGPQYNEDGDVIISEEEFLEVSIRIIIYRNSLINWSQYNEDGDVFIIEEEFL